MNQPRWKTVGQLGDKDIIGCGGAIIVVDDRPFGEPDPKAYRYHWVDKETGDCFDENPRYPSEMWILQEPVEFASNSLWSVDDLPESAEWVLYTVLLEQMKLASDEEQIYLVSVRYQPDWPHPVSAYEEWWRKDLSEVAKSIGCSTSYLIDLSCSDDPMKISTFYEALVGYHGAYEFDQTPIRYDRAGAEAFVEEWRKKEC